MRAAPLIAAATAAAAAERRAGEFAEIARRANAAAAGWRAEAPARFASVADVRRLCGLWAEGDAGYRKGLLPELELAPLPPAGGVPSDFDARAQWANCSVISTIRDQSDCGGCWAFGSTESFEDRHCVATGRDVLFSPTDTLACCGGDSCFLNLGCGGGQHSGALAWFAADGVVTGGLYNTTGTCWPNPLPPCAHHVPATPHHKPCPAQQYPTPKCEKRCATQYKKSYGADKVRAKSAHHVSGVEKIMAELVARGPLSAGMVVYSDFPTYKSGVYKHTSKDQVGQHAVELIGFGVEDGKDYWLVKNSWNAEWGDRGTFKIARGHNECGIEEDVAGNLF